MTSRAREIVESLSLAEKIALLSGRDMWHLEAVPSAGLPAIRTADGPHGLRKQDGPADAIGIAPSVPATCFPPAVTIASSWDVELAEEVGRAVGAEARAEGVGVVLGPGLNLKRHPCCGRNFEYFSEDPLVSGKMAAALTRGIQSAGVGACLKHYAVNNQETNRMVVDAVVDERTLHELYLRGFEIAVREGRPWSVMCAYNLVNGEYCSENRYLLTGVLREAWGFDGLVMSDWGATNDRVAGVAAGLDLEMPSSGGAHDRALENAVRTGALTVADLDLAAERVVALALRAADGARSESPAFDAGAHHALARRAAAEGSVLLTNDGTLPLVAPGRIALIGAFAEAPRYQGAGSSLVEPTKLDTVLEAMRQRAGDGVAVAYAPGYDAATGETDDSLVRDAVEAAGGADVAVVLAGLPGLYESEGFDRAYLRLPEGHERLIDAVCDANSATVVVLSNGAPVVMEWAGRPAAVLEAYLGGQAGGSAIVDVLFGDADPGGRLAETFPVAQEDLPADVNFPGAPRQVEYRETLWVGYRYTATAGVPVRFPFGHGLSYTSFDVGPVRLSAECFTAGDSAPRAFVSVANTGARPGSAVVQLYVRPLAPVPVRPALQLAGFAKLRLGPGEATEAEVALDVHSFAFWDTSAHAWRNAAGEYEVCAAASSADIRSRAHLVVESADGAWPPVGGAPLPRAGIAGDAEFEALLGRPIPEPRPARPFTRLSTVGELGQTPLGRRVRSLLLSMARRSADQTADPVTVAMMRRTVLEMPLRSVVTMSGGRLSWRQIDALVDALNGQYLGALRRLARRRQ